VLRREGGGRPSHHPNLCLLRPCTLQAQSSTPCGAMIGLAAHLSLKRLARRRLCERLLLHSRALALLRHLSADLRVCGSGHAPVSPCCVQHAALQGLPGQCARGRGVEQTALQQVRASCPWLLLPPQSPHLGIHPCHVLQVQLARVEVKQELAAPEAPPVPLDVGGLGVEVGLRWAVRRVCVGARRAWCLLSL